MFAVCFEIIWLRSLLAELGCLQLDLTPLHAGNASTIQIDANSVFHKCTKYIEIDCHSIHKAYEIA